jgi:enoyl-CoA hydratase/carnithine racemase
VILTGAGDFFSSGLDLNELRQRATQRDPQSAWGKDARRWHDVVEKMLRFPKPIIAAVNGPALAAGAALVLAADMVVACRHAQLSFPEARRGLVAGVATPLLCFRVGAARAAHLLLRAQPADPAVLNQWGLYHDVVEPDQVWARAHQWAQEIAELSPQSLSLTKRLLNEEVGEPLMTLLAVGAAASATAYTTDAALEGIDAFLQRRRPQWPGVEPA